MNEMFINLVYYIVVMVLTLLGCGFIQKGFFWKYLKVRASMGRLVLIKIREINRDDYKVGEIEGGKLKYTVKGKDKKLIMIPKNKPVFYKTIGITMIDIDSEKNAVCCVDYSSLEGFDAEKYNDLLLRALYKPKIDNNREKMIITCLVILLIAVAFIGYMLMQQGEVTATILNQIGNMKGSVTGGNNI